MQYNSYFPTQVKSVSAYVIFYTYIRHVSILNELTHTIRDIDLSIAK